MGIFANYYHVGKNVDSSSITFHKMKVKMHLIVGKRTGANCTNTDAKSTLLLLNLAFNYFK